MDAKIRKERGIHIVTLSGKLNHDAIESFKSICMRYLYQEPVIFQLRDLDFVGSTGIIFFVDTLKCFVEKSVNPLKFVYAKSEFQKIFSAQLPSKTEHFRSVEMAKVQFFLPIPAAAQEQQAQQAVVFEENFHEILDESITGDLEGV